MSLSKVGNPVTQLMLLDIGRCFHALAAPVILGDNHDELPCVDGLFYVFLCVLAHACDGA